MWEGDIWAIKIMKKMSKAEERALEAIPLKIDGDSRGSYDLNVDKRIVYQLGYEQAEKDNELTWQDIKKIYHLVNEVSDDLGVKAMYVNIYQETLKRFIDLKHVK